MAVLTGYVPQKLRTCEMACRYCTNGNHPQAKVSNAIHSAPATQHDTPVLQITFIRRGCSKTRRIMKPIREWKTWQVTTFRCLQYPERFTKKHHNFNVFFYSNTRMLVGVSSVCCLVQPSHDAEDRDSTRKGIMFFKNSVSKLSSPCERKIYPPPGKTDSYVIIFPVMQRGKLTQESYFLRKTIVIGSQENYRNTKIPFLCSFPLSIWTQNQSG